MTAISYQPLSKPYYPNRSNQPPQGEGRRQSGHSALENSAEWSSLLNTLLQRFSGAPGLRCWPQPFQRFLAPGGNR